MTSKIEDREGPDPNRLEAVIIIMPVGVIQALRDEAIRCQQTIHQVATGILKEELDDRAEERRGSDR